MGVLLKDIDKTNWNKCIFLTTDPDNVGELKMPVTTDNNVVLLRQDCQTLFGRDKMNREAVHDLNRIA